MDNLSLLQPFDLSTIVSILPDLPVRVYASNVVGEKLIKQRSVTRESCYRYFKKLHIDYSFELESMMDLKYALVVKDIQRFYRQLSKKITKELEKFDDKTDVVLLVRIPISYIELSSMDKVICYQIVMESKLGTLDG